MTLADTFNPYIKVIPYSIDDKPIVGLSGLFDDYLKGTL